MIEALRERWQARAEAILTRVVEGHMRRGHYADALRHTRRLLQLAPWNEEAHRQAMRLLVCQALVITHPLRVVFGVSAQAAGLIWSASLHYSPT